MANLVGKDGRLFAEPAPGADPTQFQVDNTSEQYFSSPYYQQHRLQVQPVPAPRTDPPRLDLADILGGDAVAAVQAAQRLTFHSVGDTGAAIQAHLVDEESVSDMMAADLQGSLDATPAFFFHLGDVIYYFGEAQYYYDQFYDPFRAYDRPIFAIPGNHDGMVYGDSVTSQAPPTLEAFLRNFCATTAAPSPDAGGLIRGAMTQPGVYFTLDAPLVSIIGLYSNVLEGPGVISSQSGRFPISDAQTQFLQAELQRLRPARIAGERAIILAVHHPPLSVDARHGGTTGLSADIDAACTQAGLWPDAVLSGHAHLYQRFTRRVGNKAVPYVVAGSGGFNAKIDPQEQIPSAPYTAGDVTLETDPVVAYGYLTVTVDMTTATKTLTIAFCSPKLGRNYDHVTVEIST